MAQLAPGSNLGSSRSIWPHSDSITVGNASPPSFVHAGQAAHVAAQHLPRPWCLQMPALPAAWRTPAVLVLGTLALAGEADPAPYLKLLREVRRHVFEAMDLTPSRVRGQPDLSQASCSCGVISTQSFVSGWSAEGWPHRAHVLIRCQSGSRMLASQLLACQSLAHGRHRTNFLSTFRSHGFSQ